MKLVIAQMEHETNTFSPVPTPWDSFGPQGPYTGKTVQSEMGGTRTPIGAFIDQAKKINAQIDTPLAAFAPPSGPVDGRAYDQFCELICNAISKGCDAVLLDLHGAMVVKDKTDDGEGTLLEKIRSIAPNTPIAISLDLHANVTEKIVNNCDVIVGYKTYPHIDMYEAGELASSILLKYLDGKIKPVIAWENIPVLAQTLKMDTSKGAMFDYVNAAKQEEQSNKEILAVSPFGGFPMADIEEAGISTVVVANNDVNKASEVCHRVLKTAWDRKEDFIWRDSPLKDSIGKAAKLQRGGPVLLIDHADNCASGGTQDTMHVLREALNQQLTNIAVGPILDPEVVAFLVNQGIGSSNNIQLGGKFDMPAIGKIGEPLQLSGIVENITDGEYIVTGPTFTGVKMHMGRTVLFNTGNAQIVITERLQEPHDVGVFTSVGIDPTQKNYLLLKSRMYFIPPFLPMAKEVIYCNGVGVTSSDWNLFDYKKIRRPIYPLDQDFQN